MSDAATQSPCPTVRARTILQKVRYNGDEWFGIDYNMNLYRGCCHGCIYCDSRSECYRIDDFDRVSVKSDALAILRRELRSRRTRGIVGIGAMSDTYNPFERQLRVTRGALELVEEFGFGVSVDTKSTLVTRDADLLGAIGRQGGAIAKITVTTADDELARIIEPHAPSPSKRFAALAELADAGVFCGVLFTPTLPWVTDDDATVRGVVEGAAAAGARFVFHMTGVTMRDRQRDHFLDRIAAVALAVADMLTVVAPGLPCAPVVRPVFTVGHKTRSTYRNFRASGFVLGCIYAPMILCKLIIAAVTVQRMVIFFSFAYFKGIPFAIVAVQPDMRSHRRGCYKEQRNRQETCNQPFFHVFLLLKFLKTL